MRIPRKVALIGAAVFVLALPASNAFGAASATDKKQNTRIAKLSKDLTTLKKTALDLAGTLATKTDLAAVDTRLKTIEGAAPQIISGLGALKTGLETAGAGLKSLGDAYQAVEYGVVRLYAGSTAVPGATLVSSDIPDDGNTATATGVLPYAGTAGDVLGIRAAIRSNEGDGAATGDPAGQVGGFVYAVCITGAGCGAVPAGSIGCAVAGPPTASVFQTPAGPASLSLVNIQEKSARTDQVAPKATDTDPTGGHSCTIPQTGTYNVFVSAQFVDLPTSATPGPKD